MITKPDILKMINHVTRRSHSISDRQMINPTREWALGLIIFMILLIISFIYSASRFSNYVNVETKLTAGQAATVDYQSGTMAEILKYYNERKLIYNEIRSGLSAAEVTKVYDTVIPPVIDSDSATSTAEGSPLESTDNLPTSSDIQASSTEEADTDDTGSGAELVF